MQPGRWTIERIRERTAVAAVSLSIWAAPAVAVAAGQDAGEATASPWKVGIAFGYGRRSNPLIQSEDIDILIDVDVAWFGERWFFDNGDVGRTVLERDGYTLSVVGRLNSDRVFFSKTDTENVSLLANGEPDPTTSEPLEVPERDYAFEVGLELLSDGGWGFLEAAWYHDASGTHGGDELFLSYGRSFVVGRWLLEPSVSMSWKSRELNDYYWGVHADEASVVLPEHRVAAGFNTEARLAASYWIDRHWAFHVAARCERLSGAAAASPLVTERTVRGAFAGFGYHF
ncbi:MAG TPA: MipA/OmpV family protein [Gammaproteobacteria bacterium]